MLTALKAQVTRRNGASVFRRMSAIMVNGENVVRKQRTQDTSKEFTDAMFPVPKNDNIT